jgi:1,4-dihydroxy-2-naphthoate octaprenyltransferase
MERSNNRQTAGNEQLQATPIQSPPPATRHPRPLVVWWRMLRSFSFPLSALPVAAAWAASAPAAEWNVVHLALTVLGVVLLHASGNLFNDYFDFRSGVDNVAEDEGPRPGRLLVRGVVRAESVLKAALLAGGLAALPAAYLVWVRGPALLAFALVGMAGLYAYTGRPFAMKYRALGEVAIFISFGPALLGGAAWVAAGRLVPLALYLSVPVGVVIVAVVFGNNIRDLAEDARGRARTVAARMGERVARWVYGAMVVVPVLGVALCAVLGWLPLRALIVLFSLPLALIPARLVLLRRPIPNIDAVTARFAAVFCILLTIGIMH